MRKIEVDDVIRTEVTRCKHLMRSAHSFAFSNRARDEEKSEAYDLNLEASLYSS